MQENVVRCKKCLLRETDQEKVYEDLKRYIRQIPEDERTGEEAYQERLARCKECDQLLAGMCRICGCYVEQRAAVRVRSCPMVHPRW